jgi:hypothetical protein
MIKKLAIALGLVLMVSVAGHTLALQTKYRTKVE